MPTKNTKAVQAKKTKTFTGFSEFERSAMKERANELLADSSEGERLLLGKIAEMTGEDRALAEKVHHIITANAPELTPKTWYGMPAYANKDDKVVCFFQAAIKFKARYATLGFNDPAKLDDGDMWPTSYALMKLTPEVEKTIIALVKKAAR